MVIADVRGATISPPGQKALEDDGEYGWVVMRGDHRTSNAKVRRLRAAGLLRYAPHIGAISSRFMWDAT